MLQRRTFLKLMPLAYASGLAALGTPLAPRAAKSEVVVAAAIAVACIIAARIAAHNTRPADVILLKAVNQKLGVIIENQRELLLGTAEILNQLGKLPEKIDELLRRQSVRDIHRKIAAYANLYEAEYRQLDSFRSEKQWLDDGSRRDRLKHLHYELRLAVAELRQSDYPIDPASALLAPIALTTEMSIADRIGETKLAKDTIQNDYTPWLNKMLGETAGSVVHYRKEAVSRVADVTKKINGGSVGKELLANRQAVLTCVSTVDGTPEWKEITIAKGTITGGGETPTSDVMEKIHPAVLRARDRIWINLNLKSEPIEAVQALAGDIAKAVSANGPAPTAGESEVVWLTMLGGESTKQRVTLPFATAFPSDVPADNLCTVTHVDIPDSGQREAHMINSAQWKAAMVSHATLYADIVDLNIANARIVFADQAQKVVKSSLEMLDRIKGTFT